MNFQIMHMHVFTGRDWFRRESDDLIVAAYGLAGSNGSNSDLVPGWNRILYHETLFRQRRPGLNFLQSYDYVIRWI
jgi:hypothetical protein